MKKNFWYTIGCVILLLAGGFAWVFLTVGENDPPGITVEGDPVMIGKQKLLTATFSDRGTGLRRTEIVITQDSRPRLLSSIDYPAKGVLNKPISVNLDAAALKLHDGPATLTITAVDYSLWSNRTVVERSATIDSLPPQIFQLNPANHINPGGSCVVAYRLSETASSTGVQAQPPSRPRRIPTRKIVGWARRRSQATE